MDLSPSAAASDFDFRSCLVSRANGSARLADFDWLDVTLRIRAEGVQFANDLNTFKLPGYATVDLYVARELRELMNNAKAFVAVTNLFDKQIIIGKNQTVTNIGASLTVWGGLKTRF